MIGSDLDAFTYLEIPDDPNRIEADKVAKTIYNHFIERPVSPSAKLGWKSFRELGLTQALTRDVLTGLKCYGKGYDRIRLYRLNRHTESFDGLVELGGVADNFSRVRIPIRTDALSQLPLQHRACLLHVKNKSDNYVSTYIGANKFEKPEKLVENKELTPHDLPSLDRGMLRQWIDIPLIMPHGPDTGKVVGKMTIDNARRERAQEKEISLDPCDNLLWQHAGVAADLIARYDRGKFPDWDITSRSNINVNKAYIEAFRLAMLDDQLRTLLAEIRSNFKFDRLRLYLTIKKHMELFGEYAMAMVPGKTVYRELQGFWGHVELGGVRTLFSDLIITETLDHCTRICLGAAKGSEQKFQKMLLAGEPVVFSKTTQKDQSRDYVCRVQDFYRPFELDRETSLGEMPEHLDLPIMFEGQIIGKVTIDNKWTNPNEMRIEDCQVKPLMSYSEKIGAVISAAEQMPNEDFCEVIINALEMVD